MGIMVAYGSYMKRNVNLGKAVDRIEMCDTTIALLAGLMIIPAVYVFSGTEGMSAGPGLMFVSLPRVFGSLGFVGALLGLAFFLLVLFAALTSAVSILEACVSGVIDKFQWQRKKAVRIITAWGMLLAVVVNLGYNVLYFEYELPNGAVGQILDIFDYVSNNVLMPFLAICTCILIGWVTRPDLLVGEMRLNGYHFWRKPVYVVMLKYIVPVLLVILLLGAFEIY
jgi:NSS family neurotransmitter:Na+ symporter